MHKYKNEKIIKWIVILPILGVLITSVLLVNVFLDTQKEIYDKDRFATRADVVKDTKKDAKEKVEDILSFIKVSNQILKNEAKLEAKNMIDFAHNSIENIYEKNIHLPKEQILNKIFEKLREIRFFKNLSGYFFIYNLDGTSLMHPTIPALEGKNLIGLKDANGIKFIQNTIDTLKRNDEAKVEWDWVRKKGEKPEKKYGYMKVFKPLNIFVGTGRYENDILNNTKQELQKILQNMKYGSKGYIFAYDYKGNVVSDINKNLIGKNRWNSVENDELVIQNMIKGARLLKDGFFMTYITKSDSVEKKELRKTSFLKNIPELSWVIGTGTYHIEVLKKIEQRDTVLREKLNTSMQHVLLITLTIFGFITIITYFVFTRLKKILKSYQDDLLAKNVQTTEQKELLAHNLRHDYLTSLPNRLMFADRLKQALKYSFREKKQLAIIFIDIDKFKSINDSLGHDVGDELLKMTAKRLTSSIRDVDTLARFGGDEFVLLLNEFRNAHDIITVINKIQNTFQEPIITQNLTHNITLSMGISIFPDDGVDAKTLIKNADIAMYRAKSDGRNRYRFFTSQMNIEIQKQIEIEKSLYKGVKNREFVLHYQPLIDIKSGRIAGVEALIRWNHPKKGLLFPNDFIDIAEESNVIIEMGNWIMQEAMSTMVEWKKKGYELNKMSINIAIKQLEDIAFIDSIKEALKQTSCDPKWIELEIIERFAMSDITKSIEILKELRKLEIDIAIDDFGTGYSSLSYLRNLPITKLKIDRTFVKNILNSQEDRAIAESILALGSGLHVKVLAEGIEKEEEREFFQYNGCDEMQGYLFSKPLPTKEVEKLLEKGFC